ncbi:MAG TPA: aliphatic sulfonate ABC transporter substrate-binding protein, partial [Polyangiales bacterium]|nr:aliphatic sulfonate ABC transporter substrate-binding protein [Polyangiales bacterium]
MPPSQTIAAARARRIVFEDPASQQLLARMQRIAPSDAPVLVTGETGTGKELVARQLHALSRRAQRPFVAVNAGALSESLVEAELFGHEKGAFTGAHAAKAGWFEAAHGGTLFLDEIGDLSLGLQVKLLRVLQEREITRLGSRTGLSIDVRLIAATNVDLPAAMRSKRFREDLYYRLNVASLVLPPLRERPADILALARHFVAQYARADDGPIELAPDAVQKLLNHTWPGNIRELENVIQHGLLLRSGPQLSARDLPLGAAEAARPQAEEVDVLSELERVWVGLLDRKLPDLSKRVEASLLRATYCYCGENQLETARLLGLSRNVVRARLIEHGVLAGPLRRAAIAPPSMPARRAPARRARATLRIGYQKLGLLMLVKGYGAFDAALAARGVGVEWVEYEGGIQLVEALRCRELAAGVVGDCPAVIAQAEDVPVVYFAAEPPAPRGTALIVPEHSPIAGVSELRGKRVAVNRAAQAHYLLLKALEEAGVASDEVDIRFEPPERALAQFQRGEIDAWAIWDPWLSSARLDFGARVLRDASGLMLNSAYYLARREFAERHPELIGELLRHIGVAAQWIKRDPRRAADMIAPGLGLSSRALMASLERELCTLPLSAELIAAQQDIA